MTLGRTFYTLHLVTGRIRDIRQNVLQSSVETGSRSSHSYCHIFFLIPYLEEVFIRNIIIPCNNYKIIIRINNNNAKIDNNFLKSQRTFIALQISHGQRKYLLSNLLAVWTRALKKVCQPCRRVFSTRYHIIQESGTTHSDTTYTVHYSHKQLIPFVTLITGDT